MRSVLLLPLLCACGVHVNPIILPSGDRGFEIECGGRHNSMGDCMNKAAELCGGPYHVLNADKHGNVVYNIANGDPIYREERTLTVRCGR